MAMMMSNLYDALRSAGYDDRRAKVESNLNLVKWMVGFNLALTAGVLAKMLA